MQRRGFLGGLAGIFAGACAPAIIHDAMKIVVPKQALILPAPHPLFHGNMGQIGLGNVDNGINWGDITARPDSFPPSHHLSEMYPNYDSIHPDRSYVEKYGNTMAKFMENWERHLDKVDHRLMKSPIGIA